jgi:hypothetical protein
MHLPDFRFFAIFAPVFDLPNEKKAKTVCTENHLAPTGEMTVLTAKSGRKLQIQNRYT